MLTTLLPRIHLLLYSTLLGASLFQTFVLTKISFQALPRSAFITLQKRLFPVYFRIQTLLLILTAVTLPLPLSRVMTADGVLFAVAGVTAVGNLVVYEPRTRGALGRGKRIWRVGVSLGGSGAGMGYADGVLEKSDSMTRRGGEEGLEMKRLKREFSRNHAMTIHLNLVTVGAVLLYGWRLGGKLRL